MAQKWHTRTPGKQKTPQWTNVKWQWATQNESKWQKTSRNYSYFKMCLVQQLSYQAAYSHTMAHVKLQLIYVYCDQRPITTKTCGTSYPFPRKYTSSTLFHKQGYNSSTDSDFLVYSECTESDKRISYLIMCEISNQFYLNIGVAGDTAQDLSTFKG